MFSRLLLFLLCAGILPPAFSQDHWESVVMAGDSWHYFIGINSNPTAGWQNNGFNDGAWPTGQGGFGYGDNDDATVVAPPNPFSVFTRIQFNITDTSNISSALLNMDYDDGFVAWMNGTEIARASLGTTGDYPSYNTAASDHEAVMYNAGHPASFLISKTKLNACLVNGANILAIQVNNTGTGSSDMSCLAFLSLGMKTPGTTYRTVPGWFEPPFTGFNGSNLPLVLITSGPSGIWQDTKNMCDMAIIDNGDGMLNYVTDAYNVYDGKAGIEIRGSSSTMFDKKNYGIELWKADGSDTSFSFLGMPRESDWIMHGPYSDKSLVRNYMAYTVARDMGNYAPRVRFCEMFLDGRYQGVYLLLERIKRDSGRVDIARLKTVDVLGDQLTGGYIVKIDRSGGDYSDGWFSPFIGTGTEGSAPFFALHYPQRDKILPVQKTYIKGKITAFENALHGSQWLDPYVGYKTFIDINSFVDYFIMVELSKNVDGYRLSAFMNKDRDSKDPRIHMGPVWDYDLAFGNADYLSASDVNGWSYLVQADGWGTPFWWQKMMGDPYFKNMLYCRWHEFREGVLSDEALLARVDSAVTTLGPAVTRNFTQWPIHGVYVWPNPYVGVTYEQDVNYMKNWITSRAAWLDDNIPGITCMSPVNEREGATAVMMRAYPNPAVETVNVEVQNESRETLTLEVFNYMGQVIFRKSLPDEPVITEALHLKPGAYLVKISGPSAFKVEKIQVN